MLKKQLEAAGLNENEASAYLALLELNEGSVAQIASKAGLKRPTTYLIVESLKEKGLVSTIKRKAKSLLFAEDPRKIIDILEERKAKMDRIMPELLSFANIIDRKPSIRYFEGIEGIKDVYRDTLKQADQETLTFFSDSYSTHFDEKFFTDFYFKERIKKKVWVRAILPDQPKINELTKGDIAQLRKTKIVPKGAYSINIEINLYGKNSVGIISFEENFALIIESEKIHNSLKNIFELIWSLLPDKGR